MLSQKFKTAMLRCLTLVAMSGTANLAVAIPAGETAIVSTENRVSTPAPTAERCRPIPRDQCPGKIQRAIDYNCINQNEANTLTANSNVPLCDFNDPAPEDRLMGYCPCGCFEAHTKILAASKIDETAEWLTAQDLAQAANVVSHRVYSVDATSTLSDLHLSTRDLVFSTFGKEEVPLYVLHTANGKTLKLTQNHGVLRADGVMIDARNLIVGDLLLTSLGEQVAITGIDREITTDLVYNFLVKSPENLEHTLVAEGFVVGDVAWQNNLATQIGAIAIRK